MSQIIEQKPESAPYAQGQIHIVFFGRLGNKLRVETGGYNYVSAIEYGEKSKGDGSFAVMRVLFNSAEKH